MSDNSSSSSSRVSFLAYFLQGLWKGISEPFPFLRDAIRPRGTTVGDSSFSVGLKFHEGLAALVAYLGVGVIAYSFLLERWSIVDALYFTMTCVTTLGYGDICPSNRNSMIFTCCFGMGGIAFLGAAVATIGARVVEAEIHAAQTAQKASRRRIMEIFDGMPNVLFHFRKQSDDEQHNDLLKKAKVARGEQKENFAKDPRHRVKPLSLSLGRIVSGVVVKSLPSLSLMMVGGLVMQKLNGGHWKMVDSLYYSVITGTTVIRYIRNYLFQSLRAAYHTAFSINGHHSHNDWIWGSYAADAGGQNFCHFLYSIVCCRGRRVSFQRY